MNITILGCGYVGTAVAQYWNQTLGLFVTATTTTPERVATLETVANRVEVVKGDDPEKLLSLLQNQDVVLLSVGAKGANVYQETYLKTAETLASILPQLPQLKQLIYTGSYSVYGDREGQWVDESTPINPTSENAKILWETEQTLLNAANPNLKVCIFRLGGIYGPGRELVKIWGRFAGTSRPGDGSDITNWIHLDDIVGAIEFARKHQLDGIYNLVDSSYYTSQELLDLVYTKHNLPNVIWEASQSSNRPYNARVSNQKLLQAGYQLIYPEIKESDSI